jgi:hypothetical protein
MLRFYKGGRVEARLDPTVGGCVSRDVRTRREMMTIPIPTTSDLLERIEIRELLENWVVWRDAGDWERFATVWHDDGRMIATWFQASATEYIAGCRRVFDV